MSTQITTAQALADLAYDVSDYERCWRKQSWPSEDVLARIDRDVENLSELVGAETAHEIRRALVEAAAANRSDSIACREFDESHPNKYPHYAHDLSRDEMRRFVADPEA